MSKYTYSVESNYRDEWVRLFTDSRDFCLGYLRAIQYETPRNAYRIMRSDGKMVQHEEAYLDVSVGMIAGFPTAEQYERAAERALERAKRIREREALAAVKQPENAKRIHGGVRDTKPEQSSTPLDDATC